MVALTPEVIRYIAMTESSPVATTSSGIEANHAR